MVDEYKYGELPPPPMVSLAPDAMPQQPSQAIPPVGGTMPVGGTAQQPIQDLFSPAQTTMQANPDFAAKRRLTDQLDKKMLSLTDTRHKVDDMKAGDDVQPYEEQLVTKRINDTLAELDGLKPPTPGGFSFLPGGNHRNEQVYQGQVSAYNTHREALKAKIDGLKALGDMYAKYGDQAISLVGEHSKGVDEVLRTADQLQRQQHEAIDDQIKLSRESDLQKTRQVTRAYKQMQIDFAKETNPTKKAMLGAQLQKMQIDLSTEAEMREAQMYNLESRPGRADFGAQTARDALYTNPANAPQYQPPPPPKMLRFAKQPAPPVVPGVQPQPGGAGHGDAGLTPPPPPDMKLVPPPPPDVPLTRAGVAARSAAINDALHEAEVRKANIEAATKQQKLRDGIRFSADNANMPLEDYLKKYPDEAALYHGESANTNRGGSTGIQAKFNRDEVIKFLQQREGHR